MLSQHSLKSVLEDCVGQDEEIFLKVCMGDEIRDKSFFGFQETGLFEPFGKAQLFIFTQGCLLDCVCLQDCKGVFGFLFVYPFIESLCILAYSPFLAKYAQELVFERNLQRFFKDMFLLNVSKSPQYFFDPFLPDLSFLLTQDARIGTQQPHELFAFSVCLYLFNFLRMIHLQFCPLLFLQSLLDHSLSDVPEYPFHQCLLQLVSQSCFIFTIIHEFPCGYCEIGQSIASSHQSYLLPFGLQLVPKDGSLCQYPKELLFAGLFSQALQLFLMTSFAYFLPQIGDKPSLGELESYSSDCLSLSLHEIRVSLEQLKQFILEFSVLLLVKGLYLHLAAEHAVKNSHEG